MDNRAVDEDLSYYVPRYPTLSDFTSDHALKSTGHSTMYTHVTVAGDQASDPLCLFPATAFAVINLDAWKVGCQMRLSYVT